MAQSLRLLREGDALERGEAGGVGGRAPLRFDVDRAVRRNVETSLGGVAQVDGRVDAQRRQESTRQYEGRQVRVRGGGPDRALEVDDSVGEGDGGGAGPAVRRPPVLEGQRRVSARRQR